MTRRIVYGFSVSVDGYIEGPNGDFEWATPDEEVHRYYNRAEDRFDTHIYGRRLWEMMSAFWLTADEDPATPAWAAEYAPIWRSKRKVVFSSTLDPAPEIDDLVRAVDPDAVAAWKAEPGKDMSIGGAELAAAFMAHDLIDEFQLAICPVLVGAGRPMFPALSAPLALRLVESTRFASGTHILRYERVRDA
ncbi:MAG: dihydrofolate reductase [Dehalococcoidia bacterium]|nr:dihydrofolate reductase [Dehalococcoidia bacterium]